MHASVKAVQETRKRVISTCTNEVCIIFTPFLSLYLHFLYIYHLSSYTLLLFKKGLFWANNIGGPIKVNMEFSFSFSGFSLSGLDLNFFPGSKPEIHFIFQFQFFSLRFLSNCSLWFPTRLSSQTCRVLNFFLS